MYQKRDFLIKLAWQYTQTLAFMPTNPLRAPNIHPISLENGLIAW